MRVEDKRVKGKNERAEETDEVKEAFKRRQPNRAHHVRGRKEK